MVGMTCHSHIDFTLRSLWIITQVSSRGMTEGQLQTTTSQVHVTYTLVSMSLNNQAIMLTSEYCITTVNTV